MTNAARVVRNLVIIDTDSQTKTKVRRLANFFGRQGIDISFNPDAPVARDVTAFLITANAAKIASARKAGMEAVFIFGPGKDLGLRYFRDGRLGDCDLLTKALRSLAFDLGSPMRPPSAQYDTPTSRTVQARQATATPAP
ncbi:MAG: hypothetical protein SFW62_01815 [Alphaproteobacteria bacterium]|nr:hypothetical protein [Alphaproteobacteria bacterium]